MKESELYFIHFAAKYNIFLYILKMFVICSTFV